MSLSRDDWIEMWNTIKRIDSLLLEQYERGRPFSFMRLSKCLDETTKVKKQIQSVIGQME